MWRCCTRQARKICRYSIKCQKHHRNVSVKAWVSVAMDLFPSVSSNLLYTSVLFWVSAHVTPSIGSFISWHILRRFIGKDGLCFHLFTDDIVKCVLLCFTTDPNKFWDTTWVWALPFFFVIWFSVWAWTVVCRRSLVCWHQLRPEWERTPASSSNRQPFSWEVAVTRLTGRKQEWSAYSEAFH